MTATLAYICISFTEKPVRAESSTLQTYTVINHITLQHHYADISEMECSLGDEGKIPHDDDLSMKLKRILTMITSGNNTAIQCRYRTQTELQH